MIALALPASANTIGIKDGVLIVGAEPGDGNQEFRVLEAGPNWAFDLDAEIVTPGCTRVGGIIECEKLGVGEMVFIGSDGDDRIDVSNISTHNLIIWELGEAGNDTLIGGGDGDVRLYGGSGDDDFTATPGNCVSTGTGNDTVFGTSRVCGTPEPDFKPLPRQAVATPEPGGFVSLASGLVALVAAGGLKFRRGLTKRPTP
jgi:hypothetical protein